MNFVINHCKNRSFNPTESRYHQYFAFKSWILEKNAINDFLMHNSFEFSRQFGVEKKCKQPWLPVLDLEI